MIDDSERLQAAHRAGARSMLALLNGLVDSLDKAALSTGPDPRMGPGPLEGVPCLVLNDYVRRVFLKPGEKAIATMERELG